MNSILKNCFRMTPKEKREKYGEDANNYYEVFYFMMEDNEIRITYDKYAEFKIICNSEKLPQCLGFLFEVTDNLGYIIDFLANRYNFFKITKNTYPLEMEGFYTFLKEFPSFNYKLVDTDFTLYNPNPYIGFMQEKWQRHYDNMVNDGFQKEKILNKAKHVFLGF